MVLVAEVLYTFRAQIYQAETWMVIFHGIKLWSSSMANERKNIVTNYGSTSSMAQLAYVRDNYNDFKI